MATCWWSRQTITGSRAPYLTQHLLGKEETLDSIQKRYSVDVLVNLSSEVESQIAIGGYSLASASVTMSCRAVESAHFFEQQVSEAQNGFGGMPEWLGATREAARKVALQAAIASVFLGMDLKSVTYPVPVKPMFELLQTNKPMDQVVFLKKHLFNDKEAAKLTGLAQPTIGRREKITCSVLDADRRLAAVGITGIDIDLQRNRRTDAARFSVFDMQKSRNIRSMDLPGSVKGIRRPKSRDISDFTFLPTGRFLILSSKHPVLWLYDNFSGNLLAHIKLPNVPKEVHVSENGSVVKVDCDQGQFFYNIEKR